MKSKSAIFSLFLILFPLSVMAQPTWLCWNREASRLPISLDWKEDQLKLSFQKTSCTLERQNYRPTSEKYKGWIKFGMAPGQFSADANCNQIATKLFAESNEEFVGLHWVKISSDLQRGRIGSVQIGFENNWDPSAGGTVSSFFFCPKSE